MRLTRFSDIGLRVLMYLARSPRGDLVTVAEFSQQFDVPHNHVVKVIGALARHGWVQTTRGRHGGIQLQTAPESMRVGDIMRTLEGDKEAVDCTGLDCRLAGNCFLRHALRAAVDAFYESMNRHTVADLVGSNTGEQIIEIHRQYLREPTEDTEKETL